MGISIGIGKPRRPGSPGGSINVDGDGGGVEAQPDFSNSGPNGDQPAPGVGIDTTTETPAAPAAPKPIDANDPEVQRKLAEAQAAERKPRSRAATLFSTHGNTSDFGLSLSRRTLMGY